MKTLIYGYGNPGRQDDGLGMAFCDKIEHWARQNQIVSLDFDRNYQLNIEDALTISHYDLVIFADASRENIADFQLTRIEASAEVNFTMHAVSPSYIYYLCNEIYGKAPNVYLLHIKGYRWEMKESLSSHARMNLNKAFKLIAEIIKDSRFILQDIDDLVNYKLEHVGTLKF